MSTNFAEPVVLIVHEFLFYSVDNKNLTSSGVGDGLEFALFQTIKFGQNVPTHNKVKPQVPVTSSVQVRGTYFPLSIFEEDQ